MILAGHIEFYPDGSAESTMWEWQSGVPLPTPITTIPPLQEPPLMDDTTTATTNATADDTTGATTPAAPAPERGGGEGETVEEAVGGAEVAE